jgi:hypothetical protein
MGLCWPISPRIGISSASNAAGLYFLRRAPSTPEPLAAPIVSSRTV